MLNTSFNENEPIVCTPRDAIGASRRHAMDVLYLGNHAVRRESSVSCSCQLSVICCHIKQV